MISRRTKVALGRVQDISVLAAFFEWIHSLIRLDAHHAWRGEIAVSVLVEVAAVSREGG